MLFLGSKLHNARLHLAECLEHAKYSFLSPYWQGAKESLNQISDYQFTPYASSQPLVIIFR